MKKYKISKEYYFIIIPLILISVSFGSLLIARNSIIIGIPFLVTCGCIWFLFFNSAREISISENAIEIISAFRRFVIIPSDIKSIEDHFYYHRVLYKSGSFYFANLIDNLPSLKNDLKKLSGVSHIEEKSDEGLFRPVKGVSWVERILIFSLIVAILSIVGSFIL